MCVISGVVLEVLSRHHNALLWGGIYLIALGALFAFLDWRESKVDSAESGK